MKIKTFLILFFIIINCFGQKKFSDTTNQSPKIYNSFRVDLNDSEVNEIYNLYSNYINSSPDKIYDNPYWNEKEKKLYKQFDFSAVAIYNSNNINIDYVLKNMDIFILSIEKLNNKTYTLSVQYQLKGGLQNSNSIWCIQRINAIKDVDNNWRLQNYLNFYTNTWTTYDTNNITYHFKPKYPFETSIAKEANDFINETLLKYKLDSSKKINYYLVETIDELGLLRGFDFFGAGVTTGITSIKDNYIMSSKGPFHAHELVHFIFQTTNVDRNFLLEEGIAEFLGSKPYQKNYLKDQNKLFKDIKADSLYSPKNLFYEKQEVPWNGYDWRYAFGALLCEIVYEQMGVNGLKHLLYQNTSSPNELIKRIITILNLKNENELYNLILEKANKN